MLVSRDPAYAGCSDREAGIFRLTRCVDTATGSRTTSQAGTVAASDNGQLARMRWNESVTRSNTVPVRTGTRDRDQPALGIGRSTSSSEASRFAIAASERTAPRDSEYGVRYSDIVLSRADVSTVSRLRGIIEPAATSGQDGRRARASTVIAGEGTGARARAQARVRYRMGSEAFI